MSHIVCEVNEGVALIRLNRPEMHNALNLPMLEELMNAVQTIRHQPDLRAVIVTGSGEKAFCAGADLKERISMNEAQVRQYLDLIRETFQAVSSLPVPVIAAINGVAFGGGFELLLACDLRIAEEHAVLGLTETSLAIIPGAGGTQRLPRLIGVSKAKELIYLGKRITAWEAEELGLLNRIVSKGKALETAQTWANMIKEQGPIAIRQAKLAIDQGMETDLKTGLMIERMAYEVLIPTQDRLEGLKAFQEKRKPVYQGK